MTLNAPDKCLTCGSQLPAKAVQDQCVRCALELALQAGSVETTAPPTAAKFFGDFELLAEIARGGMGVVWRARQISLNRTVAIKLLLAGQFATESAIRRFEFEAEAAANLDHPNIVPIYEVGEQDGWPFIAMKLIEGRSLAESTMIQARSKEGIRKSVELLVKVARAVHHAHLRGLLHRDLKPSNILIDENGEPHVTDFGLAKGIGADGRLTFTGAILGSPFYMSPEQTGGGAGQLSIAADIWSLGVILYELLSGSVPFRAESPVATLKQVLETDPAPPRSVNPLVDLDLQTICLKCLAKSPAGRYESAVEFARDLQCWLNQEPISARPASRLQRSVKWLRRHPLKAGFVAVTILAILGPLISTFYMYHFVLPRHARSHPVFGYDLNVSGFSLTFETNTADRATMNFDPLEFGKRRRQALICFTNLPLDALAWSSNLTMQIFADIPAAPDVPRSPIIRAGEWFPVQSPGSRDRAFYICPFGWRGEDVLRRAPDAHLLIIITEGEERLK